MDITEFELSLNNWGKNKIPFLFLVDFEMEMPRAWPLNEVPDDILFSISNTTDITLHPTSSLKDTVVEVQPIRQEEYRTKFNVVKKNTLQGNSYLTNLTIKTPIAIHQPLHEIFHQADAKYKFCWKEKFLVFSPETFVQIMDGKIYSFPMKGTIDASLPGAEEQLMGDAKELSEHVTIVDLIRNDLSSVATHVQVVRFRYLEKVKTNNKNLLQTSSEIVGELPKDYLSKLGTILVSLLPAGSISGAPKRETIRIIEEAEGEKRKYYTGVMGIFDGEKIDSAVMIRFIEQQGDQFYYRSGGGITSQSELEKEYQEALDKIYVPFY
ncbi:MAG: aminodeoxychorismate synthase component I [Bacteroidetes bacterium]|nr:aminodeoxychorismate synthase component I [Bacteroidota bacterium]MBS1540314.1 aminodeoxychorismate synthase component I [Bacteroidota bacterium]